MSTASEPDDGPPSRPDDKAGAEALPDARGADDGGRVGETGDAGGPAALDFDPYRFGRPEHPVPAEYAPPGYVPDPPAPPSPTGPPTSPPAGPYGGPSYPYPPPPYGAAPHGVPPYGAPAPHQSQGGGNGKAITALVCGIGSVLLCWLSILDVLLAIVAFVFGVLGINEARKRGVGKGTGKGMAVAGVVLAVIGAILAITVTVLGARAYSHCGGNSNRDDPGFEKCLRQNIF